MTTLLSLLLDSKPLPFDKVNHIARTAHCVCCLSEDVPFVCLEKCRHKLHLLELFGNKIAIDFGGKAICMYCHRFLQKIEKFKQLVQNNVHFAISSAKSSTQTPPLLKTTAACLLSIVPVSFAPSTENEDVKDPFILLQERPKAGEGPEGGSGQTGVVSEEIDIKTEEFSDVEPDKEEVKVETVKETEDSSTESEKELTEFMKGHVPTRVLKMTEVYKSRVSIVTLDAQQVLTEREAAKKCPLYANKEFQCEWCIKGFLTKRALESHMERHDPKSGAFFCPTCNSYHKTENRLNAHYKIHFTRYDCVICKRRFTTENSCCAHYNELHGKEHGVLAFGFSCKQCQFVTDSYRALLQHKRKHSIGYHKCEVCFKIYTTAYGRDAHMRNFHGKERPSYRCKTCDKVYYSVSYLKCHMATAHPAEGSEPGSAYCVDCDTAFINQRSLLAHLKTHSRHVAKEEPKLICDYCGDKFHNKPEIQRHIYRRHMPINRCEVCSKTLSTPRGLRRHVERVHQGKKAPRNKICQYCGKGFTTTITLQSHIRTHTLERPLKCPHCTATFAHPGARYTHIKLLHNPDRVRKQKQPNKKQSNKKQSNQNATEDDDNKS